MYFCGPQVDSDIARWQTLARTSRLPHAAIIATCPPGAADVALPPRTEKHEPHPLPSSRKRAECVRLPNAATITAGIMRFSSGVWLLALATGASAFTGASATVLNSTQARNAYSFTKHPTLVSSDAAAETRGYRDPAGVLVHSSLSAVPASVWASGAANRVRCSDGACDVGRVCGAGCEPVLLRVSAKCGGGRWCPGARKFLRCFARLCYTRLGKQRPWLRRMRRPHLDRSAFAILRYTRPVPAFERRARRMKQTASQSAIFR